jgi:hypothetical protein
VRGRLRSPITKRGGVRGLADDASGVARRRRKGKRCGGLALWCGRSEWSRGERCRARREEEGKANKRVPLVSCPGRKVKGCDEGPAGLGRGGLRCAEKKKRRRWAGPCASGPCQVGKKEKGGGLAWAVGRGGFIRLAFEFDFEWPIQIQIPLN